MEKPKLNDQILDAFVDLNIESGSSAEGDKKIDGPIEELKNDTKKEGKDLLDEIQKVEQDSGEDALPQGEVEKKQATILEDLKKEEETQDRKLKEKANKPKRAKVIKPKDKAYKNNYIYGIIFFAFAIIFEIAGMCYLNLGIIPTSFGIGFGIIIMLAGAIFIVPTKIAKITISTLIITAMTFLNILNAGCYFSTGNLLDLKNGIDFFLDGGALILNVIILIIYLTVLVFGTLFMPRYKVQKNKTSITALIVLLLTIEIAGVGATTFSSHAYFNLKYEYIMESNNYLYADSFNSLASYKRFGGLCYFGNALFNSRNVDEDTRTDLTNKYNAGTNFAYQNSRLGTEVVSGKLNKDNLLIISLEGFSPVAIDPYNTPNIYEFIYDDAITIESIYGDSQNEEAILLGAKLKNSNAKDIFDNNKKNNDALASLFLADDYGAINYLQNSKKTDNNYYKNIGFKNSYFAQENIGEKEFVQTNIQKITSQNSKFFTYYSTKNIADKLSENIANKANYDIFEDNYLKYSHYVNSNNLKFLYPDDKTNEYNILKEYKSRAIAVDDAIGTILIYLKTHVDKNGVSLWNNTTVVLVGGFGGNNILQLNGFENKQIEKEQYKIPFGIYNKKLHSAELKKVASAVDLYSTICDLYGLAFNEFLTNGVSAFANKNSVFVNQSMAINQNFYTTTYDKYFANDNDLSTNAKLDEFKQDLDLYLKKQIDIENYYIAKLFAE